MEERLQKVLSRAGLGSRRECEELIRQGRVTVNGQIARLGQKADPEHDQVAVDNQAVRARQQHTTIMLHKPRGVLSDEGDGRPGAPPTARHLAGLTDRLFVVGRLDLNSEGLLLLTDDGELAHRLTHPRYEHPKEYEVLVEGQPDERALESWRRGVFLDGRPTAPAEVTLLRQEPGRTWLRVVLREGRKRQVRRVAAMLGFPVLRLIRVRIGPLRLGDLPPGRWRRLSEAELAALRAETMDDRPQTTKHETRHETFHHHNRRAGRIR